MINVFYRLYVLTKKYKSASIVLFFLFLGTSAFFASRIHLEENIINAIPKDENIVQINRALEGFKMNSRLVVHLYFNDSLGDNPQELIDVAHQLSDSIQAQYADLVNDIRLAFPDTQLQELYAYYSQHLPLYLSAEDYNEISTRTTEAGIAKTVENNYKALISPMSIVAKKMLVKDPFGLLGIPLQNTQKLQLDDNIQLYQNHLLTKDRKHLIFFLGLTNPPNETANNGTLIDGLDDLIKVFKTETPTINIEYFGQTAVSVANAKKIKQDIILTVSLAVLALFLFITLFYKNVRIFFIAITPGLFGATVALACLTLIKTSVSVISLGIGAVLLGITIDYALHFATHYKDQNKVDALFKDLTMPLLMSSATTACAFFSLLFLRSDALADLGIFAGVSILSASLYTLIVFPHLVIREKKGTETASRRFNFVERIVNKGASYPFYKAKWSIGLFLLLSFISLFTWKNYSFENNMLRLNYMPDHLAQYEKNLNAISTYSASNIYLISTGANLQEALEEEAKVKQALQNLKDEGVIYNYLTVNDIFPAPSVQQERLEKWKAYWEENNEDSLFAKFNQAASKAGFRSDGFVDFKKLLKADYSLLDEEDAKTIFSVIGEDFIIQDEGQVAVISSIKTDPANKKAVLQRLEHINGPLVFDMGYLTAHLVKLLQEDFNKLVNLSLIVVFALILLNYGRIELALIAFIPIALSWLWILGVMGLFGLKFNIVNIIVCTFIFGLGIDYSIFSMQGYTQKYQSGLKTIFSYRKSIILSAATTLLSIGVLAFAEHPALKSIALLAIIGISSVIFITFTIQPICYNIFIAKRKKKGLLPYTLGTLLRSVFAFLYFLLGCLLLTLVRVLFYLPFASKEGRKKHFHWVLMWFCKSLIYIMANVKKTVQGREHTDFNKPAVIIANHHSFLDIILMLMFHPKVIMITNDWVYNSPFFGKVVRYADFVSTTKGVEEQSNKIKDMIQKGYSIVVFPEGTRSDSFELHRFHKGAFYLAHHLKLDIQPVILHGTNYTMPRKDPFYLKNGRVTVKFLPRIVYGSESFGETYSESTKKISKYFKSEYEVLRKELETPDFFKETILKNYIYKGPIIEWYLKVKYRLEKGYALFHTLVPHKANIVDVGCGYGMLSYALALSSSERKIVGIDHDEDKIEIANHCPVKPDHLQFKYGDVTNYAYESADVFIVSDVLHYLLPEEQKQLLNNIVDKLNVGGKIILRDGDSSKKERHKGTEMTEVFSTKSGFNKTKNPLHFISAEMITLFATENKLELTIVDNTKYTSNIVFVLEKKG